MYYNITYNFKGKEKESKVSFFHLDRFMKWLSLMIDSLEYVTVETFVKGELFNKFTWQVVNGKLYVVGGEF